MSFDPIALVERAYQHHESHSAWLQGALEDVAQAVDPSCLMALSYVHGSQGPEGPIVVRGSSAFSTEQANDLISTSFAASTPEEHGTIAAACRKPGVTSLRHILGDTTMVAWLGRRPGPMPFVDAVGVIVSGPHGKPVVLAVPCSKLYRIQEREHAIWHRIAIHWSAACRLAGRAPDVEAQDVEVVLSADGQVAHAQGAGAGRQARELLRQASKDIDRARCQKGRADPLAALELWQGLLAGRWSLVEHFDSDGRRFMLARRNEPGLPEPAALTQRQRQVVFYASLGLSNKETAYALGLAENTISAHLAAGLARLRIKSRAELIRTSNELAARALAALASSRS